MSALEPERLELDMGGHREALFVHPGDIPLVRHRSIEFLYQENIKKPLLREFPDPQDWTDDNLYPEFCEAYQDLAERLILGITVAHLTPESRTRFFICTRVDDVIHPSGLDRLLGYTRKSSSPTPDNEIPITTGRFDLDLMADLAISPLAQHLHWLRHEYSAAELSACLRQAYDRQNPEAARKRIKQAEDKRRIAQSPSLSQLIQSRAAAFFGKSIDPKQLGVVPPPPIQNDVQPKP